MNLSHEMSIRDIPMRGQHVGAYQREWPGRRFGGNKLALDPNQFRDPVFARTAVVELTRNDQIGKNRSDLKSKLKMVSTMLATGLFQIVVPLCGRRLEFVFFQPV